MMGILEQMAASLERIECFMAKTRGAEEQVDQKHSPLGSRRHCAAVRRRRAEALGGAEIIGKRHLLTRAALAEELDRCSSRIPQNDVLPSGDDAYHRAMSIARNPRKTPK
jgi:hypothetical protein